MATGSNAPNWQALLDAYGEGAADVEIARLLKITINRFYQLIEETPAFAEFVERGRTLAQAWWYEKGRTCLWDKNFNTALWNFNMKNRYGWADKVDTSDKTDSDPVNLDQAKAQLATALKQLGKKNPELLSGANLNESSNRD
jgi:hypothetical protein